VRARPRSDRGGASYCDEFVLYKMEADHARSVCFLKVTHDRVPHSIPERLNALRLREDRVPKGTCLIPALWRFLNDENHFAIHLQPLSYHSWSLGAHGPARRAAGKPHRRYGRPRAYSTV